MNSHGLLLIAVFLTTLLACSKPLGVYIARIYSDSAPILECWLGPWERFVYRLCGIDRTKEMNWQQYSFAVLTFSLVSFLAVYLLQRSQSILPLNPNQLPAVNAEISFNTAISFVTNTNWQAYSGETTMSSFTQMFALTVQNFLSAATGLAVLVALIRGFVRHGTDQIGNFWVDMLRATWYVLLPLSLALALLLVTQGVVQTWKGSTVVDLLEPAADAHEAIRHTQQLALGPVASQVAIKQLGTNGGGIFNVNSAHPFENPTPWTNFLELIAILLIPAALCFTFGELVGDRRQGWALLATMTIIFVPLLTLAVYSEQSGTPILSELNVDQTAGDEQSGGNMEGKETRFGITSSALWAVATTAASNGSVNSMHDSYLPLGNLATLWLMQLGEVIFGGVGSGLYGMLMFALVAVFIAGLMVGRTPEYLGKKIGAFEMKMATIAILSPCATVLLGTAIAVGLAAGRESIFNPGPHGFSEVLYAFSSAGNNNGSAMAGLGASTAFYNGLLGIAMFVGRFSVMIPVLAIAGSLATKKRIPVGPGTLSTSSPLFIGLLIAVVIVVGALSFLPALALGPIAEQLQTSLMN